MVEKKELAGRSGELYAAQPAILSSRVVPEHDSGGVSSDRIAERLPLYLLYGHHDGLWEG